MARSSRGAAFVVGVFQVDALRRSGLRFATDGRLVVDETHEARGAFEQRALLAFWFPYACVCLRVTVFHFWFRRIVLHWVDFLIFFRGA